MAEVLKEMKDPLSPWIPLRKDRGGEKQQSLSLVIEIQNVIKGGEKEELYLPSSPPPPRFLLPCHSSFSFLPSSTFWLLRARGEGEGGTERREEEEEEEEEGAPSLLSPTGKGPSLLLFSQPGRDRGERHSNRRGRHMLL